MLRELLVDHLLADAGVAEIADDRVHLNVRPDGGALPAVVVTIVSAVPLAEHLKGDAARAQSRVQVDCYAEHPNGADAVALAHAVLSATTAPMSSGGVVAVRSGVTWPVDFSDRTEDRFIHRQMVELTIWHNG